MQLSYILENNHLMTTLYLVDGHIETITGKNPFRVGIFTSIELAVTTVNLLVGKNEHFQYGKGLLVRTSSIKYWIKISELKLNVVADLKAILA